jgi:four helix bundle protein
MSEFRFQELEIWKESKNLTKRLFIVASNLRNEKYLSFSDQLFRATLSITNDIAEGSGSTSKKDFANYLLISRKSVFECANILIILHEFNLINALPASFPLHPVQPLSEHPAVKHASSGRE